MKLICPFCKVEYSAASAAGARVQCVCCGHIWCVNQPGRGGLLLVFAGIVALLSAIVFAVVLLVGFNQKNKGIDTPITASVEDITPVRQESGDIYYTVHGRVENKSDKVHGIPDIVIILQDEYGNTIASQRFLAPAPVLAAGEEATFSHTIEKNVPDAKKVSVEFHE